MVYLWFSKRHASSSMKVTQVGTEMGLGRKYQEEVLEIYCYTDPLSTLWNRQ